MEPNLSLPILHGCRLLPDCASSPNSVYFASWIFQVARNKMIDESAPLAVPSIDYRMRTDVGCSLRQRVVRPGLRLLRLREGTVHARSSQCAFPIELETRILVWSYIHLPPGTLTELATLATLLLR